MTQKVTFGRMRKVNKHALNTLLTGTGRAPAGILSTPPLYPHLFGECFLAQILSKTASLLGKPTLR